MTDLEYFWMRVRVAGWIAFACLVSSYGAAMLADWCLANGWLATASILIISALAQLAASVAYVFAIAAGINEARREEQRKGAQS